MCVLDALFRLMPMHIKKCDVGEGRTWWQCNAKRRRYRLDRGVVVEETCVALCLSLEEFF